MYACMCIQSYSITDLFCKRALEKLSQKSPKKETLFLPKSLQYECMYVYWICIYVYIDFLWVCMYMYFGLFCVCKNRENGNFRERVWQNDGLFEREKTHVRERERQQRGALSIYKYDYVCVRVCFQVWGYLCVFYEGSSVKVFLGTCECVWACVSVGCSECR